MDAPERGALTLVRLVGVMCVVATILELGLYWAQCVFHKPPAPVKAGPVLWDLLPAVAGCVILARARVIAEWISNILGD